MTPAERHDGNKPANHEPRFETRKRVAPTMKLRGKRGVELALDVRFLEDRRHLPIVGLKRAA